MSLGERYFFVDALDVQKTLWILKSDKTSRNYYSNGSISAKIIFDINGVPEEYQKIIMKSDLLMGLKKYNAVEFVSDFPFYFVKHKRYLSESKIDVNCIPFYDFDSDQWFYNFISFRTLLSYTSYASVVKFFHDMNREGLMFAYFKSLKQLFDLNNDIVEKICYSEREFKKFLKK